MTCPCKFPILIVRDGIQFLALPLEEIEKGLSEIPEIYDEVDDNGVEWVVVQWHDDVYNNLHTYEVVGHNVIAGCSENRLSCDSKDIYKVYHPKDEWNNYHVVNMD